ncbi:MAG: hypothetical protein QXP36_03280 [Conexivisphaerales archaeon]
MMSKYISENRNFPSFAIKDYYVKDDFLFIRILPKDDDKKSQLPVVLVFDKDGIIGHFAEIDNSTSQNVLRNKLHYFYYANRFVGTKYYSLALSYIPSVLIYDNGFLIRTLGRTLLKFKNDNLEYVSLYNKNFIEDVRSLILKNSNLYGKVHDLSFSWIKGNKATNLALVLESILKKSNLSSFDIYHILMHFIYPDQSSSSDIYENAFLLFNRDKDQLHFFTLSSISVAYFSIDVKNMSLSDYCVVKLREDMRMNNNSGIDLSSSNAVILALSDLYENDGAKCKDICFSVAKSKESFEKALRLSGLQNDKFSIYELIDYLEEQPSYLVSDNFFKALSEVADRSDNLVNKLKVVLLNVVLDSFSSSDAKIHFLDADEHSPAFSFFEKFSIRSVVTKYDKYSFEGIVNSLNFVVDKSYVDYSIVKSTSKRFSLAEYFYSYGTKMSFATSLPIFFYNDRFFLNVFAIKHPDGIKLYKLQVVDDRIANKISLRIIPTQDSYKSYSDVYSALVSHSVVWDEKHILVEDGFTCRYSPDSEILRYEPFSDVAEGLYKKFSDKIASEFASGKVQQDLYELGNEL